MYNPPYIFIDSSYVAYFTMHSTWSWYKKQFILDDNDYRLDGDFDPSTDPEYSLQLEKRFNWNIYGLLNKIVPMYDKSRITFALDCHKKDIWRNHYYPQYKLARYTTKTPFNFKGSFNLIINNIIPNKCEEDNSVMIGCNNAEADDVIATIILKKYQKDNSKNNILIASDRDLSQLTPYAKMFDIFKKQITMKTSYDKDKVTELLTEDSEHVGNFILYKALKGDNSDGISGILPKIGPKTAIKYINNKDILKQVCDENSQAFKNLKRNIKIMDLKKIPKVIQDDIWGKWEKLNSNRSVDAK